MSERNLVAYVAGELDEAKTAALEQELDESPQLFAKLVFMLSEETMLAEILHEEAAANADECEACSATPPIDMLPNEELFTAYIGGQMSDAEAQELEDQLDSDPELKEELAEFCKQRAMLAEALVPEQKRVKSISRQKARRRRYRNRQQQPRQSAAGLWLKVAASIALLASAIWIVSTMLQPKDPQVVTDDPAPNTPNDVKSAKIAGLMKFEGVVAILRKGNEYPVSSSMGLLPGDIIRTSSGSARIELCDDIITVRGQSTVQVNLKKISLSRGTITAKIAKHPASSPMIFETPTARVKVFGTEFTLNASSDTSQIEMAEGSVLFSSIHSGSSKTVRGGEYAIVSGQQLTTGSLDDEKVIGFTLMNADTKRPIKGFDPIQSNATVVLSKLPGNKLTIRANTVPMLVDRVKLELYGPEGFETIKNFESKYPYLIKRSGIGDDYVDGNDYNPVQLPPGAYKITACVWGRGKDARRSEDVTLEFDVKE